MSAFEDLTEALKSGDHARQQDGIRIAREANSFFHLLMIYDLIASPVEEVTRAARQVSLDMAKDCLHSTKDLPEAVFSSAVEVIRRLEPAYEKNLHAGLESNDVDVVIHSLMLLKFFLKKLEAQDILGRFVVHGDSRVRATAVLHLGGIATKADVDILTGFLEDNDNRVIANTIEVLDELQDKSFVKLLNRFRDHPNNRVRGNVLKALYAVGELSVKEDLRFMLMDPNPLMRASAVWVLREMGSRAFYHLELLKIVAGDQDEMVRNNLRLLLKHLGDIPQLEFLRKSLEAGAHKEHEKIAPEALELTAREQFAKHYCELQLQGVITERTAGKLAAILAKVSAQDARVVADLAGVAFVNHPGVEGLVSADEKLGQKKGFLYLVNANYKVMETINLAPGGKKLQIFNSLDEVRQFLGVEAPSILKRIFGLS